ncbi:MAG: 2-phosphosulfolactate phosphatase [Armatimonadetes bacterium]|nr:2-phosphosulfolactate phosphatase [Armatimonadota bacterium]
MILDVRFTPSAFASGTDLRNATAVVIDVLRASSTIVAALMSGAREVIPTDSVESAVAIAHRIGSDRTVLAGERNSVPIPGFQLGNSPASCNAETVSGKTVVMTTTNGTRAFQQTHGAQMVLCGALMNARNVAQRVAAAGDDQRVVLLCAGSYGQFSMDDAIGAGAIVRELRDIAGDNLTILDSANAALQLFQQAERDVSEALLQSDHGAHLAKLGFADDVRFCAQLNVSAAPVPSFDGSLLRIADPASAPQPQLRF